MNTSPSALRSSPSKQVFVVEDHVYLREVMTEFLSYHPQIEICGAAATAEEALEVLPAGADAITVDLTLGSGMPGIALVRHIKEHWPAIKCVVLSAHPELELGAKVREAGADAYVEKGDEDKLLETLQSLLGLST